MMLTSPRPRSAHTPALSNCMAAPRRRHFLNAVDPAERCPHPHSHRLLAQPSAQPALLHSASQGNRGPTPDCAMPSPIVLVLVDGGAASLRLSRVLLRLRVPRLFPPRERRAWQHGSPWRAPARVHGAGRAWLQGFVLLPGSPPYCDTVTDHRAKLQSRRPVIRDPRRPLRDDRYAEPPKFQPSATSRTPLPRGTSRWSVILSSNDQTRTWALCFLKKLICLSKSVFNGPPLPSPPAINTSTT